MSVVWSSVVENNQGEKTGSEWLHNKISQLSGRNIIGASLPFPESNLLFLFTCGISIQMLSQGIDLSVRSSISRYSFFLSGPRMSPN